VGVTTTLAEVLTHRPPASLIVTPTPYVPALLNVTVVFLAAFLPLTLKVADPPLGSAVTNHV